MARRRVRTDGLGLDHSRRAMVLASWVRTRVVSVVDTLPVKPASMAGLILAATGYHAEQALAFARDCQAASGDRYWGRVVSDLEVVVAEDASRKAAG